MNRPLALLACVVFGGILPVLLVVLWLTEPAPAPPAPRAMPPPITLPEVPLPTGSDPATIALRQSIRNGERIYHRLCYHCHGRRGTGDNNEYMANIGHKPADHSDLRAMQKLSDDEFFVALRDGVKDKRGWLTMPPWASVLTAGEMWDVIAYVRRLPLAPEPPRGRAQGRPGSPRP
jgi:mono/diheme cytochrome c family protein